MYNKINNMKHIQLPNDMTLDKQLTPKDLLVYAILKSYMNSKTKSCYPSIDTIVKDSKISKPTVLKSIHKLEELKYIKIDKSKRNNVYTFLKYESFEVFSIDFLKEESIDVNEKAYILASQQMMYKDVQGFGKITYSDSELSKIINLDKRSIAKYNKSLEEKGFLTLVPMQSSDQITGIKNNEKLFHLNDLGQAIIWVLGKHEIQINQNSKDVKYLLKQVEELKEIAKQQQILTDNLISKYNTTKDELDELKNNSNEQIIL